VRHDASHTRLKSNGVMSDSMGVAV
jgi:hypothetical protein